MEDKSNENTLTEQEVIEAIERYNDGWGARRDCEDAYEVLGKMTKFIDSYVKSEEGGDLATKEAEICTEWNEVCSKLIANLNARANQSKRVHEGGQMPSLSAFLLDEDKGIALEEEPHKELLEPIRFQTDEELKLLRHKKFLQNHIKRYEDLIQDERAKHCK